MKIAYLVNQYPKVSHSFIRTEILAVERQGLAVARYAMRGWDAEIVDPLDTAEREKTRYVLRDGALPLLLATLMTALRRPRRFAQALAAAWRLARGGERGFALHLIYLAEACRLLGWLAEDGCTHVHAHFGSNAASVALLVHALGGPPYSMTIHGSEEFYKPLPWKLREKVAGASFVAAVTAFCRSQLFCWSDPADWHKVHVVHCAIDPRFEDRPTTPPPANDRLVSVGRLCAQKGQVLLVDAIAALKRRGVPVHLVLAGDGEMRPDVERAIAAGDVQDRVTITGWVDADEIVALLEGARALVLPSFLEGLPVVLMEAMARGRPVLSTGITGIPELVRNDIDGLLIPAGDEEALTDALDRLLALDAEALARMGAAAKQRALARHASDTEAAKLAALFRAAATA